MIYKVFGTKFDQNSRIINKCSFSFISPLLMLANFISKKLTKCSLYRYKNHYQGIVVYIETNNVEWIKFNFRYLNVFIFRYWYDINCTMYYSFNSGLVLI